MTKKKIFDKKKKLLARMCGDWSPYSFLLGLLTSVSTLENSLEDSQIFKDRSII
jgi:hypothetical protein